MKKIGIITLYYNNNNYGGVAQAYALNKYFLNLGYDSELITYEMDKNRKKYVNINKSVSFYKKKIFKKINNLKGVFCEKTIGKKYMQKLRLREQLLEEFRNSIPHSECFNKDTIAKIENRYDVFVTGSDQTWNPSVIDDAFVFSFLNKEDKNIFSYASSIAVDTISDEYAKMMNIELKKYKNISVREDKSQKLLQKVIDKDAELVIDPTLLIDKNEWKNLTSERIIKEKYMFCYMLGSDTKQRKIIKKYAKSKGLKLVTLPYIKNGNEFKFRVEDYRFGDIQMLNITFNDFLSLINNAEMIITDSFHAVCFSYIFGKEFFVFEKKAIISTSSRIYSLMELFQTTDRIIKNDIPKEFDKIDYSKAEENVFKMAKKSREYIDKSLN